MERCARYRRCTAAASRPRISAPVGSLFESCGPGGCSAPGRAVTASLDNLEFDPRTGGAWNLAAAIRRDGLQIVLAGA